MLRETATCDVARLSLSQCRRHFLLLKKMTKSWICLRVSFSMSWLYPYSLHIIAPYHTSSNMFTCITLYVSTLSLHSSDHCSLSHFLTLSGLSLRLPITLLHSLWPFPPTPHHVSSLSPTPYHASSLSLATKHGAPPVLDSKSQPWPFMANN